MSNIIPFTGETFAEMSAEKILEGAKKAGLETAIVIGLNEDGRLFLSGTTSDLGKIFIMLELAKRDFLGMITE